MIRRIFPAKATSKKFFSKNIKENLNQYVETFYENRNIWEEIYPSEAQKIQKFYDVSKRDNQGLQKVKKFFLYRPLLNPSGTYSTEKPAKD